MVQVFQHLSRRERQILDVLYKLGRATAAEVRTALADRPSYSAVRASLRILEQKGHAKHEEQGLRYVFLPALPEGKARRSAVKHLLETFFHGSPEQAVSTLLDVASGQLTPEDLDRIARRIEQARKEGR
jgi:BlaI family transcriptional regulator, penicillinase repressor